MQYLKRFFLITQNLNVNKALENSMPGVILIVPTPNPACVVPP
jgi:hypothetical protein